MHSSNYLCSYFCSKFVPFLVVLLVFFFFGCNQTDEVVTPGNVTNIETNGSLTPTSHSSVEGSLFVTDQEGNPVTISTGDVSAVMTWASDDPSASSNGTVTLTSSSNQHIASAITMDYSGSMHTPTTLIPCMETGVTAYINRMHHGDLAELIKFSTDVAVVQNFTTSKPDLLNAVTSNSPTGGTTALYQSIYKATMDVSGQSNNCLRTVIAFTDGAENHSTISRADMITEALTHGIPIFTVTLLNSGADPQDMQGISDTTGGFAFTVEPDSCEIIENVYEQINTQVNNAYSYTITWPISEMPPSGTTVTVTISVNYKGLISSFEKTFRLP